MLPTISDEEKVPRPILVAGLGNLLLRDDGIGAHAARLLVPSPPPGSRVLEVGTAVLDALDEFEKADRILLLDALISGGQPGTVSVLSLDDVLSGGPLGSLHDLSVLQMLRFTNHKQPPEVLVLGVEPARIEFGIDLSDELEAILPTLLDIVRSVVARWNALPLPSLGTLLVDLARNGPSLPPNDGGVTR